MAATVGLAWRLLRPHVFLLASVSLVVWIPLESAIAATEDAYGAGSWESFAAIFAAGALDTIVYALAIAVCAGAPFGESSLLSLRRALPLAALYVVVCGGVLVGLVLLVVPGIVLATWWVLAFQPLLLERTSVTTALARSRELVRGHFWHGLGIVVLSVALYATAPAATALALDSTKVQFAALVLGDVLATVGSAALTTAFYLHLRDESPASLAG